MMVEANIVATLFQAAFIPGILAALGYMAGHRHRRPDQSRRPVLPAAARYPRR